MRQTRLAKQMAEEYPVGTRVRLTYLDDKADIDPGTTGTVTHIDILGTVFVDWDNGEKLGLIKDIDHWDKI